MSGRSRVTIVGGGIAGLTLAAALDPDRFAVTVLEAEPGRAALGGALMLWPSAVRALRRLGAGDLVDRHGRTAVTGVVRDVSTGRPILSAGQVCLTIVRRPDLLAALEACVPRTVRREETLVEDPRRLAGHVVVGADGVRSRVRGLVRPNAAQRIQTPYLALRGLSDQAPSPDAVGEYWGRGRLFGLVPLDRGAYWFTTHRSGLGPEPIDLAEALAETREVFASAAPSVVDVLAGAEDDSVVPTRIWVAPTMPCFARGRYVVIGDAAHAMTPNMGRGACDAIVDAVSLAGALASPAAGAFSSAAALARWQARRVPFTQATRLASAAVMRVALSGQPGRALGAGRARGVREQG